MSTTHRCPVCQLEHHEPRASNVTRVMILNALILVLEVAVALALTGWLALGMWLLVTYNVIRIIVLTHGLATLAARQDTTP